MKFNPSRCPVCGAEPKGTCDTLAATARLRHDEENDTFDYAGESDVHWNSQSHELDAQGRVKLCCREDHEWFADLFDDAGNPMYGPDAGATVTAALLTALKAMTALFDVRGHYVANNDRSPFHTSQALKLASDAIAAAEPPQEADNDSPTQPR